MAKKLYRRIRDDRYQALQELPDQRPRRIAVERENPPSLADPPVPCCDCFTICDDPRKVPPNFNSGSSGNAWPLQWLVHGDTQFHFAPHNPIGDVPTYDFSAGGTSNRRGFLNPGEYQNPQAGIPPLTNIFQSCMASPTLAPAERPYIIFPLTHAVCGNIGFVSPIDRIEYQVKFSQAPDGEFYNPQPQSCDDICTDPVEGPKFGAYPPGSEMRNRVGTLYPSMDWPSGLGEDLSVLIPSTIPASGSLGFTMNPVTGASNYCPSFGAVVWKDNYIECMNGVAMDRLTSTGGHSISCFLLASTAYRDVSLGPLFCSAVGGWHLPFSGDEDECWTEAIACWDGVNYGQCCYEVLGTFYLVVSYSNNPATYVDVRCYGGPAQTYIAGGIPFNMLGLNCSEGETSGPFEFSDEPAGCFGDGNPVYGHREVEVGPCVTGNTYERVMIENPAIHTTDWFAYARNLLLLNGDNLRIQCDYSNSHRFFADRAKPGCYWHRTKLTFNGPYVPYPIYDPEHDRYAIDLSGPDMWQPKFSVQALAMYGPPEFGFVGGQLCTAAYFGDGVQYTVEWNSADGSDIEQVYVESNSGPGIYNIHDQGHIFLDLKVDEQKKITEFRGGGIGHTSEWTQETPIPLVTADTLPSLCLWLISVEQAWSVHHQTRGFLELMEQLSIDMGGDTPWTSTLPPSGVPWNQAPMKGCSYDFTPFCAASRSPAPARYKLGPCSIVYSS